jgi:hypothetical protein
MLALGKGAEELVRRTSRGKRMRELTFAMVMDVVVSVL